KMKNRPEKSEMISISENQFKASDGFTISYRAIVPENAKAAMILLHGMDRYFHTYLEAMKGLAVAGILALAPEQRGRGKSVDGNWKDSEMQSVARIVQDVREL